MRSLLPGLVSLFAICWCTLFTLDGATAQSNNASSETPSMVYDFSQVPLDYDDPTQGATALAFIRIAAATQPAPTILLNPGGPGGSGVGELLGAAPLLVSLLGTSYNIVYFDPRGINSTTPNIDCFPGAPDARDIFRSLYMRDVSDGSSTSLASQFTLAEAYGKWCSNVVGGPNGTARFVGTAAVARDMLTFIEAEQRSLGLPESEAKLWYYGYSYGTVLGATFASMFPDRVGRMVLDSVMDGEDYYRQQWKSTINDADKVIERFFKDCSAAGPDGCSFWGPSSQDVQSRFDSILSSLKDRPLPVWNTLGDMPHIATYADLKQILRQAVYFPRLRFPLLADIMHGLENGNGSLLIASSGLYLAPLPNRLSWNSGDAGSIIPCVDGWGRNNLTLEGWREHADFLVNQSRYIGDAWGHIPLDCVSMDVPPPPSGRFSGYLPPSADHTSFPILFVTNDLDPVTPIENAHKMSAAFPGSVVVSQNGIGHVTFIANPSNCTTRHVQAYFNGTLPSVNTTCEVDVKASIGTNASVQS